MADAEATPPLHRHARRSTQRGRDAHRVDRAVRRSRDGGHRRVRADEGDDGCRANRRVQRHAQSGRTSVCRSRHRYRRDPGERGSEQPSGGHGAAYSVPTSKPHGEPFVAYERNTWSVAKYGASCAGVQYLRRLIGDRTNGLVDGRNRGGLRGRLGTWPRTAGERGGHLRGVNPVFGAFLAPGCVDFGSARAPCRTCGSGIRRWLVPGSWR